MYFDLDIVYSIDFLQISSNINTIIIIDLYTYLNFFRSMRLFFALKYYCNKNRKKIYLFYENLCKALKEIELK